MTDSKYQDTPCPRCGGTDLHHDSETKDTGKVIVSTCRACEYQQETPVTW